MVRARVFGLSVIKGKTGRPKTSEGYTFVEVMVVLAVSSLMFVAAMIAVGGQQNETGFSLAMQDLNSKIQNYVSQVKAADAFNLGDYSCGASAKTGRPVLSAGSGNDSGDCIYLGVAIQPVPGTSTIYAYNVLGNRTIHNPDGTDTGASATTIDGANPEPALDDSDPQNFVNVDTYNMLSGVTITKATVDGRSDASYDLVGVYNALQNDQITAGTAAGGIVLKAYPFTSTADNAKSASLTSCIEENSPCDSGSLVNGQQWDMCFASRDGQRVAELTLGNSPNGLTTQLIFDKCTT